ncbi:MAG: sensor histidine kinase [Bacteroides sp.]|nr:sensor histidine kinase [Bacteroides sp.]
MIKKILLLLTFLLCGAQYGFSNAEKVDEIERQLNQKLAHTRSQEDSIKILYDLFDLVPRREKLHYSTELYNLATRLDRNDIRLDLLRQLSQLAPAVGNPDSVYRYINEEVSKIPRSREQEETALFIRMRQVAGEARVADSKKIEGRIAQLIAEEPRAKDFPLNLRVLRLFTIVEYLTNSGVEGGLLGEYVGMLKERMSQADFQLYALNNILLTESANIYTTIGNPKEAVEADKQMLKMIGDLENKYHSEGRKYRNYLPNKYIIYRRMLGNFPALTPQEIEEFYSKIREYVKEDEDVQRTENNTQLALLTYSMATKDYATAIPLIRKTLMKEEQPAKRRRLLFWLKTAAEGVGDKDTQIEALQLYNDMLIERDTSSSSDRAKELDIRTRVNELRADNVHLQIEKEKEEKESVERMMSFVMIGWVVFAAILFVLLFIWMKYRTATVRIGQFIKNLDDECLYLKEQQYSDYMRDDTEKRVNVLNKKEILRRKRSKSIIDMLNYIMNDLLYISSIGKLGRGKFIRPVSVRQVIIDESAIARANQTSGAKLEIVYPEHDIELRTDKECLEYILHHIFFAANRVAEGGEIKLEVRENDHGDKVEFVFSNSSVFVPEGNEDVMFDNFLDIEKLCERDDAGLFLARLSAMLLDGKIYLDRTYTEGSRYIFSVSKVMGR